MRKTAALALALLVAADPARAATAARAAGAAAASRGVPVVVPALNRAAPLLNLSLAPSLVTPALTLAPGVSLAPSITATPGVTASAAANLPSATPTAEAARADLGARIQSMSQGVALETESQKNAGSEGSSLSAERQFALLTGAALPTPKDYQFQAAPSVNGRAALEKPQQPAPPSPEAKRNVRLMRLGTAAMKSGMEVVKLGIPLLALQVLGSATSVALLAVSYGVAQAIFGSWAGALTDRVPASRVLTGAIVAQAVLIASLVGLAAAGVFTPWILFPVYALVGGAVGVAETTRRVVPPLMLGQDTETLKKYNGSLHLFYEVAGVGGALLAGVLIAAFGPLNAMLLQPPAFALAAFMFWKVKHSFVKAPPQEGGKWQGVKAYFNDLKAGVKTVVGSPAVRWVALAMVLPQLVHRVFEDLLLPVFAKKVLEAPGQAAYMLASSNLGELLGAVLVLKLAERFKGAQSWVKWSALGLLGAWALTFSASLPVLLPIILVFSMTWAASDLSLLSELQSRVSSKELPRVLSVILAAAVVGGIVVSLLMGRVLDWVALGPAFIGINVAFTALAALVYYASRRLASKS